MILPETYVATILLMVLSMICFGSWPSTFKASRLRFELYYFDFVFGFLVAAIILAFTMGTMGFDGFSFLDDVQHAGKREDFYAFAAGIVFNMANMLLMGAITVSGMAVAFPISVGLTMIVGILASRVQKTAGNPMLMFLGCALILAAILLACAAYRFINEIRHEASARAGKAKSTKRPVAVKGIVIAAVSGLLMAAFYPLLAKSRMGEVGLGPYSLCVILALGAFLSTFVFNLFFMNLPVEGEAVDFMEYFKSSPMTHGWAVLGGVTWCVGLLAGLTAASADNVRVVLSLRYGLSEGFALIAILWGALVWKEFRDGDARTKSLVGLMFVLFGLGVALISVAQTLIVRQA
jgi:glucose uptake protein